MVVVPPGSFMMGSTDGGADEKPVHKVTIANPFAVGKFEVTFAEWDACVAAGGCKHKPNDHGWGRAGMPVIEASWDDISREYLPWLSRKAGKAYHLLTEAEWEYTARAGSRTKYSWGEALVENSANCDHCGSRWDKKQTAPVRVVSAKRLRASRYATAPSSPTKCRFAEALVFNEKRCLKPGDNFTAAS